MFILYRKVKQSKSELDGGLNVLGLIRKRASL